MFWSFLGNAGKAASALGNATKGMASGIASGMKTAVDVRNKLNPIEQPNQQRFGIFDYMAEKKPIQNIPMDYARQYLDNFNQKFQGISSMFSNRNKGVK